jgi:hypothetical protein
MKNIVNPWQLLLLHHHSNNNNTMMVIMLVEVVVDLRQRHVVIKLKRLTPLLWPSTWLFYSSFFIMRSSPSRSTYCCAFTLFRLLIHVDRHCTPSLIQSLV